jgi:hypothetical protein
LPWALLRRTEERRWPHREIACGQHEVPGRRWNDADRRAVASLHGQPDRLPAEARLWSFKEALAHLAEDRGQAHEVTAGAALRRSEVLVRQCRRTGGRRRKVILDHTALPSCLCRPNSGPSPTPVVPTAGGNCCTTIRRVQGAEAATADAGPAGRPGVHRYCGLEADWPFSDASGRRPAAATPLVSAGTFSTRLP